VQLEDAALSRTLRSCLHKRDHPQKIRLDGKLTSSESVIDDEVRLPELAAKLELALR